MPGETGLHEGFQIIPECFVGSNFFFHSWIALRKMLHKSDCFIIKWDTNEIIWSSEKDDSFVTVLLV